MEEAALSSSPQYSVNDLITSSKEIEKGFIAQTLEKSKRAKPILDEAFGFKRRILEVDSVDKLLDNPELHNYLLLAAGVSTKAAQHLEQSSKEEVIRALIEDCQPLAKEQYADELVFRYLLAWGDSLGGSLRNWIGLEAKNRFTEILISQMTELGKTYAWLDKNLGQRNAWVTQQPSDLSRVKGLAWDAPGGKRVLLYNRKIPLVNKNVDVSVLRMDYEDIRQEHLRNPSLYVAMGEIKGGIDPAGADEHWKTANSALNRVRSSFAGQGLVVKTFFVGAIIVQSQAEEIVSQLSRGLLDYAANLTQGEQMDSLCSWLISL